MWFCHIPRFYNTGVCNHLCDTGFLKAGFKPVNLQVAAALVLGSGQGHEMLGMCMEAHRPICTSKWQPPLHPPAQQHNLHKDISAQLFIQSYLPAAERNLETGSFHNIWVWGWAEFRLSDPQPMPGFWSDEHWCRYHTYAIPNSFFTQAIIKCSMSWHIIQLGLKEPG